MPLLYDSCNSADDSCGDAARDDTGEYAGDGDGDGAGDDVHEYWSFVLSQFLDPVKEDLFSTSSEYSNLKYVLGAGTGGELLMALLNARSSGDADRDETGEYAGDGSCDGAGDDVHEYWSFVLSQLLDPVKEDLFSTSSEYSNLKYVLGAGNGGELLMALLNARGSGDADRDETGEYAGDGGCDGAGDDVHEYWSFVLSQFLDPGKEDLLSTSSECSDLDCILGAGTGGELLMALLDARGSGDSADGGCGDVARDDTGEYAGDGGCDGAGDDVHKYWSFVLSQFLDPGKEDLLSTLSECSGLNCILGAGTGGGLLVSVLHTRGTGEGVNSGSGDAARDDTGDDTGDDSGDGADGVVHDSWSFVLLQFLGLCKSTW